MANMDEMERAIRMRSESLGFKLTIVVLAAWTLVELVLYLAMGRGYDFAPGLVLIVVLLAQGFAEQPMKRRMVAGDEEYHEPSRLAQTVVAAVAVATVAFFVGFVALYAA